MIEWMGHSANLEEPLQAIVDSNWQRDKFVQGYLLYLDVKAKQRELDSCLTEKNWEAGLKIIKENSENFESEFPIDSFDDNFRHPSFLEFSNIPAWYITKLEFLASIPDSNYPAEQYFLGLLSPKYKDIEVGLRILRLFTRLFSTGAIESPRVKDCLLYTSPSPRDRG